MELPDKDLILEQINLSITSGIVPHNTALGLRAVDCGPGGVVVELPYAEQLIGHPGTGVLHGGAITSLLDATCGMAVFLKLHALHRIATLDLRIDYLGPAEPKRSVLARAECFKVTRNVAFVRAVAYHDPAEDPIAAAAGAFALFRGERSPLAHAMGGSG